MLISGPDLLPLLARVDPASAGKVLDRVLALLGEDRGADLRSAGIPLPDGFVEAAASRLSRPQLVRLARNRRLTNVQLAVLVEAHGGEELLTAAFGLPGEPDRPRESGGARDPEGPGLPQDPGEARDAGGARDFGKARDAGVPAVTPGLDAALARLRAPDRDPRTVAALLRAHPLLAWIGRDADLARVLLPGRAEIASVSAERDTLLRALTLGAADLPGLVSRICPARVCLQWLAWLWREQGRNVPRADVAAVVRELFAPLGTDPAAWEAFARLVGRHRGTIAELVAEALDRAVAQTGWQAAKQAPEPSGGPATEPPAGPATEPPAGPATEPSGGPATEPSGPAAAAAPGALPAAGVRVTVPKAVRPSISFVLRLLGAGVAGALLPYLDDELAGPGLLPGDVSPDPDMAELALTTRHPPLLAALAGHQHLDERHARRIARMDDRALDLALAINVTGINAALRRELLAGTAHGGDRPRLPLDDDLRQWAIRATSPGATQYIERTSLAFSGDPALVALGLPSCTRLRHIDQYDVVLSLWERSGVDAVADVLKSLTPAERDRAFAARVLTRVQAAVKAKDPGPLRAERARIAARRPAPRRARGPREVEPWELPAAERIRELPLGPTGLHWAVNAVVYGELTAADLVRHAHPAVHALGVARQVTTLANGGPVAAALADVAARVGGDPEAWAVFVQLLPDFVGTLPELADVAVAAVS